MWWLGVLVQDAMVVGCDILYTLVKDSSADMTEPLNPTAPTPISEASTLMIYSLVRSECFRMGVVVKADLSLVNASSTAWIPGNFLGPLCSKRGGVEPLDELPVKICKPQKTL